MNTRLRLRKQKGFHRSGRQWPRHVLGAKNLQVLFSWYLRWLNFDNEYLLFSTPKTSALVVGPLPFLGFVYNGRGNVQNVYRYSGSLSFSSHTSFLSCPGDITAYLPHSTANSFEQYYNMFLIATLPNEVLLEIFKCYIDLPNQLKDFHGDTRFVIAGVCRHWRTLLVEAPLLWKAITIDHRSFLPHPLYDSNVPPWSIFLRTSLALHWSGYQPLDVTIKLPDVPTPNFNSNHAALIARLLHHAAPRIASLEVSGDAWEMNLQALRWLLNTPMPLLRTFTHIVFEEIDVSEEIQYENFTSHSNCLIPILQYPFPDATTNLITVNSWGHALYPRLESVEINGAPYKTGLLPTIGLKKLELRNQPVNACPPHALIRDILSFCADTLEDLSLSGFLQHPSDGPTSAVPNPLVLHNLSTLTFGYQASDEVAKFLPDIRTPALRRLEVTDDFMSFRAVSQARKHYTDSMLNALIRYLPLNQLERLILGHVVFKDEIAIPDVDAFLLEEKVAGKDVPFTLRFLSSLSSLQHLEIWITMEYGTVMLDAGDADHNS